MMAYCMLHVVQAASVLLCLFASDAVSDVAVVGHIHHFSYHLS